MSAHASPNGWRGGQPHVARRRTPHRAGVARDVGPPAAPAVRRMRVPFMPHASAFMNNPP